MKVKFEEFENEFSNLLLAIVFIPFGYLVYSIKPDLIGLICGIDLVVLGTYFLIKLFVDAQEKETQKEVKEKWNYF